MKYNLTEKEINIIKIWADNTISGGHWGDGDAIFPDEGIVLKKISEFDGMKIDLTQRDMDIIKIWAESYLGGNLNTKLTLNIDEKILLKKLNLIT